MIGVCIPADGEDLSHGALVTFIEGSWNARDDLPGPDEVATTEDAFLVVRKLMSRETYNAGRREQRHADQVRVYARPDRTDSDGLSKARDALFWQVHDHAVEQLPPRLREAYEKCVLQDRPQKEVAKEMKLSPKVVSKYVRRALAKLQEELREFGG